MVTESDHADGGESDIIPAMAEVGVQDPLRLEVCPACGYSLQGLPEEGVCPECGQKYNQAVIVLHGWGRGTHASVHTSPLWLAVGLCALNCFNLIYLFIFLRRTWFIGPVVLICAAPIILIFWRRRKTTLPGLVQVLVSSGGCAQLDNPTSRRTVPPTPWTSVADVDFFPLGNGHYRLRMLTQRGRWRFASTPVDAEVRLDPDKAQVLRQRIREWRKSPPSVPPAIVGGARYVETGQER
jgi:hypothetical protein